VKTAKIFKSGGSQAVRLPKEFRMTGDWVFVKRDRATIVLIPKKAAWSSLVSSLKKFTPDFMEERIQPPVQRRKVL
jgi:antitoxin VapB